MTQVTAMFVMFILYGVLPVAGLYLGYRGIKKMTAPKMLEYKAMPQLGYIPEKSLPVEVKTALDQINEKGEKLRVIYGDTNNDGKIDDKDTVNETYIMIQNLMDRHVPLAVTDYRRLHDLDVGDGARADTTKIKHSNVTGKEALLDVLRTINTQFDDLLNASYHQDGQKLLATNRYLQKRFNNPATTTDIQKLDSNVSSVSSANTDIEIKAIENPTGATGKNVSAENIKL
ncbi:hypothetical protein JCM18902_1053 [Psychrobacter sp. JCM 18902]|uniref:hypothetical protein n=1 Tax=Psychrobacter sp. JCM 18902 TaxID=1298607 RepID=UPI000433F430|nr:hypothetical protein [Psychrobacter sp. JCM 18902]GAF58276.1 hypothetical protein JCM18902_1053 [Psychrobacter sp. JCM 18902]